MDTATLPRLLSATEVARWLSLPPTRVERMAKRGEMPSRVLPSGDRVFDAEDLARWLRSLPEGKGSHHAD